ncbi:signal peptidase II [Ferrimicrobium sp.]|uniref:signal peptidase II n=1 Tax=Ferrimicrobium sp. TaxID=2926050 RepID=UPI0026114706|nr:signal peptidase II [Ferrimicrobium sp.]
MWAVRAEECNLSKCSRDLRSARWLSLTVVVLVTVVVDLATSVWARTYLRTRTPSFFGGIVKLRLVYNTGAAFGIGEQHEWLVELAEVVVIVALWFLLRSTNWIGRIGFALAIGGGVGNLVVRWIGSDGPLRSPVIDWIHLSFYPTTFNIADIALRVGIVVAIAGLILDGRRRRASRGSQPSATATLDESSLLLRHEPQPPKE